FKSIDVGRSFACPDDLTAADNGIRLHVFGVDADGKLWESAQAHFDPLGFRSFVSLGGSGIKSIAVGYERDLRLAVFAIGSDNAVWQDYVTGGGTWSGFSSLGGSGVTAIAVGQDVNGRPHVFAIGSGGTVWENAQFRDDSQGGGSWTGFYGLGASGAT